MYYSYNREMGARLCKRICDWRESVTWFWSGCKNDVYRVYTFLECVLLPCPFASCCR